MSVASFGFHSASLIPSEEELEQRSLLSSNARASLGGIGSVVAISAIAATAISCPLLVPVILAGAAVTLTLTGVVGDQLWRYRKICQNAGIIFNSTSSIRPLSVEGSSQIIATEHSSETEEWRERLIAAAEYNIVLSGNYCGGKAFDRFIGLLEKRLQEKPDLKVIVLASPKFVTKHQIARFKKLSKSYAGNVALIDSPDIWHISPQIKKSTNHTKVCVVDYGRYWIQGGSGIKDNFVEPGIDDLTRAKYRGEEEITPTDDGLLGKFIPGAFRDADFVGESEVGINTIGTQTYLQALLLAHQLDERNRRLKRERPMVLRADEIGLLAGTSSPSKSKDSLAVRMLREALPVGLDLPRIPEFSSDSRQATADVKIFAQGPGHDSSPIAQELIAQIHASEREIVINHMYFHPTKEIFDALVAAANRGVRITIITNGLHEKAPSSHHFFAARNRYNYNQLVSRTREENRGRIHVFEYTQKKKGNHKKVIVVDDTVIAGSSNLGLKSQKWSCDDELNFVARSQELSKRVLEICEVDIAYSRKVTSFQQRVRATVAAAAQRGLAFLIEAIAKLTT